MNAEETIAKFEAQQKAFWQALKAAQDLEFVSLPYSTEQVIGWAKALFDLCPLQVGDAVEIVDPPVITPEESWGWMGAKHLFVVGRRGHVRGLGHQDGQFCVYFEFDVQTWIDQHGKERLCDKSSLFFVAEKRLRKAK